MQGVGANRFLRYHLKQETNQIPMQTLIRAAAAVMLLSSVLPADFSYTSNTKLTGGSMAGAMKFAGKMGGQNITDVTQQTYVSGDRMATLDENNGTIINLADETIVTINFKKQEYSIMTFAQMKAALEQMQAKADKEMAKARKKNPDAGEMQMNLSVEVKDPGRSENIGGIQTKEMILLIDTQFENQQQNASGAMNMAMNMWMAEGVAGADEMKDFYRRMAEQLDWSPGSSMISAMGRGMNANESMAELQKKMAELEGFPVKQIMRMGGSIDGMEQLSEQDQSEVAAAQEAQPGMKDALKGALGGFGGFGRKKKKNKEPEPQANSGAMTAGQAGVLMEMTTFNSGFSTAAVPADKFKAPSGFKQVENPMAKSLR